MSNEGAGGSSDQERRGGGPRLFGPRRPGGPPRTLAQSILYWGAGAVEIGDRGLALDVVELGGVGQAMGQHRDGRDDHDGDPDAADRAPIEDRLRQGAWRAVAGPELSL